MRNCNYCGIETTNPKYCSLSCGAKDRPRTKTVRLVPCKECGKEFDNVGKPTQIFCSQSCAATFNNRLTGHTKNTHRPRNSKGSIAWNDCANCGSPCRRKYCSTRCFQDKRISDKIEAWLSTGDTGSKSTPARVSIRQYIHDQQSGLCLLCGIEPIWNGKPFSLILDHIDGDSTNNARENLRLICPNCDATLDIYKSKNKGKGRAYRRERYAEGKSY